MGSLGVEGVLSFSTLTSHPVKFQSSLTVLYTQL